MVTGFARDQGFAKIHNQYVALLHTRLTGDRTALKKLRGTSEKSSIAEGVSDLQMSCGGNEVYGPPDLKQVTAKLDDCSRFTRL